MEQEDKGNDETPKATREKMHVYLQRNIRVTAEFLITREAKKQYRSIFRGERKGSHQSRVAHSVKKFPSGARMKQTYLPTKKDESISQIFVYTYVG